jgi:DNA helicase II / ATP-dependent DNA helicase PcrA
MIVNFINGSNHLILKQFNKDTFVINDLMNLKGELKELLHVENPLGIVLKELNNKDLLNSNRVQKIIKDYQELGKENFIHNLLEIKLGEYLKFYSQVNNETKLQTLHGVKGDEFEKVVINIRHQQNWKTYNFDSLFLEGVNGSASNQNAHKLFYVACTRAKSTLIINYISETTDVELIDAVCKNVKKMFGDFIKTYKYQSKGIPKQLIE